MKKLNLTNMMNTFSDTKMHETVAEIIYSHSTNKLDVREAALEGLQFESANLLVDLGCGFGFFTRALKGKLKTGARITGIDQCADYQSPYLESCKLAGVKGNFIASGINALKEIQTNSVDFIICSYAMYFFPEIIPEISRILKPEGTFVTITHSINHLNELFFCIKKTFDELDIQYPEYLPYELLIRNFSDENGLRLLSPYFDHIHEKEYRSSLVFNNGDDNSFRKYLQFKQPFYTPDTMKNDPTVFHKIITNLCSKLNTEDAIKITKDDTIFVCTNPT